MELSPLLIAGLVLLAVVAGLAIWQRAQQVDRTAGRQSAPPATMTPAPTATDGGTADSDVVFAKDPVLGGLEWYQGSWSVEDDVAFAGTTVCVEVTADRSGITASQREIVRAALEQQQDLDTRARAVIRQELDRQGIGESAMEAYEIAVRPRGDGREAGFLWYDVTEADREMGVSSTDGWRTLTLETFE